MPYKVISFQEHPDLQTKGITTNEVLYRCQLKKGVNRDVKPSAKKQKLKTPSPLLIDHLQVSCLNC